MFNFFDKLEDNVREHLSNHPIPYSIIGGIGVVLFWRGVWETAELISHVNRFWEIFFFPPAQVILSIAGLMLTGLMVSVFVGDRIILSGVRHEKKVEEDTEKIVKEEEITLKHLRDEIRDLKKEIRGTTENKK